MKKNIFLALGFFVFAGTCVASFSDKIKNSGIDFVHFNGMSGEFYFHEMMGAGVALFDYDNDGDLDVYFSQGNMIGDKSIKQAIFQPQQKMPLSDRLYRNDSTKGELKFVDVTKEANINAFGYGMGVSIADIDNDGDLDIYLANYGANQMLLNNGDGTFSDVTNRTKTNDSNWSIVASFFDYDKDGFLDLYVVNYVDYTISSPIKCKSYDGALDYCSPQGFEATADVLFHNNRDGTFTNVTSKSGIGQEKQPGLGVVSADFNNDGWVDLYVANDGAPNILWINNKKGGFVNKAMRSGVAVNMTGIAEASMGVDAADFDNDGDFDLFMTHLNRQTNTLYVNNGKGWFADSGIRMGVASSSFRSTGFGTKWFDFDNDGYLDLFSANGAVIKEPAQVKEKVKFPLKQSNQLWRNKGNNTYQEVSMEQDKSFLRSSVSRGAAFGDLDNDGDIDIVVTNNSDKPQILINSQTVANNWIGLKLKEKNTKHDGIGAKIKLITQDKTFYKTVKVDGSYASSHDPRVLFGLGKLKKIDSLEITWTSGKKQIIKNFKINSYNTILEENK